MGEVNAIDYRLRILSTESTFIRELIRYRLSEYGRRARQAGSKEWKLHTFASEEGSVIVFGWENLDTGERSLITANCSIDAVEIDLPDPWNQNFNLLTVMVRAMRLPPFNLFLFHGFQYCNRIMQPFALNHTSVHILNYGMSELFGLHPNIS